MFLCEQYDLATALKGKISYFPRFIGEELRPKVIMRVALSRTTRKH